MSKRALACHTCRVLYDGKLTAHRSCGVAMAETFGRQSRAYLALRRGGVTGKGTCGVLVSGRLVLGELLSPEDVTASTSQALLSAVETYEHAVQGVLTELGVGGLSVCDSLTSRFDDFRGEERHQFCTTLASAVAGVVAEIADSHGATWETPVVPSP